MSSVLIRHRVRSCVSAALAMLVVALVAQARAGTPEPGFSDSLVVGGLSSPTAIAFLPDGKLLVTEKGGALKLFDGSSTTTLVAIPVCTGSEMGLLGIAIDPDFSSNGFIYLYRTKAGAGGCGTSTGRFNQVVRVTMSGGSVNLASLTELLSGIRTDNGNHNGGVLRVGPDLKLWVGVGDTGLGDNTGGPGSATNPYAQDLGSLNGKALRVNLDGTVPADNPFAGTAGARGEVWAYGFRNPFRMSFDSETGKLWIGDVGDLTVEEIDIGVAGGNYSSGRGARAICRDRRARRSRVWWAPTSRRSSRTGTAGRRRSATASSVARSPAARSAPWPEATCSGTAPPASSTARR
jgi:glucose/arabinose dehydrogenase